MAAAALRVSLRFRQMLVQQPLRAWKKYPTSILGIVSIDLPYIVVYTLACLLLFNPVRSISASTSHTAKKKERDLDLGDYPDLPRISHQLLPPTGWTDNQERRNKETPVSR